MRRLALLPFALAISCSPAAVGISAEDDWETPNAIINGDACDEQTDDTALAILVDATLDIFGQTASVTTVMCTGTLIAKDVVLTAAHCTDPSLLTGGFGTVERADFYVTFQADLEAVASSDQQPPPEVPAGAVPVNAVIAHEEFDINNFNTVNGPGDFKDVAVMFLAAPITDVEPEVVITAAEAASAMEVGDAVEIAGWGQQTATGGFQQPPAGSVGVKQCGASTINEIGDFEMQIGSDPSTTRKCHGDSGGPTYLDVGGDHTRTRRVVGVTSHAYDQEDCNKGGVDTRVDVHLDWLDGKLTSACDDGTRVACDGPAGIIPPDFYDPSKPDDDDDPAKKGCAAAPAAPLSALALAILAIRRRGRR